MPSRMNRPIVSTMALLLGLIPCAVTAAGDEPFGLAKRIPWDERRLSGSPEPPLPYTVEKTFTKHSWRSPLYVADEPGTDRLWVVQEGNAAGKGSQVVRIPDDPDSPESEVLLDLPGRLIYSVCFHPGYATNGLVYVFSN